MSDSLVEARRRERLSQAAWRRQRAEVARLVAAGEEAAARKLLAQAGGPMEEIGRCQPEVSHNPQSESPDRSAPAPGTPEEASPGRTEEKPAQVSALGSVEPSPRSIRRRGSRRTWTVWLKERPPWAVSLVTHGVFLIVFGLLSVATLGEPSFSLSATLGEDRSLDDLPAPITLEESLPEADDTLPPLPEPLTESLDVVAEVPLESLIEPVSFEPLTDLGDLIANTALTDSLAEGAPVQGKPADTASQGGGAPRKKGGRVSFFGAESEATRVVFVVDNSGSMQHGRMETTLFELERAVGRLAVEQEFYVVFFSDQAYPMFFPEGVDHAMPATRANKRRLSAWLHTVEICLGGRLLDAMELAAGLEPDVVYLLTDGDIRSQRVVGRMTERDAWPFTIHTLGMGARRPQHAQLLNQIATNAGGVYRPVGANPRAVARARQRPIPYHREPGPVWGSAVTPWR